MNGFAIRSFFASEKFPHLRCGHVSLAKNDRIANPYIFRLRKMTRLRIRAFFATSARVAKNVRIANSDIFSQPLPLRVAKNARIANSDIFRSPCARCEKCPNCEFGHFSQPLGRASTCNEKKLEIKLKKSEIKLKIIVYLCFGFSNVVAWTSLRVSTQYKKL